MSDYLLSLVQDFVDRKYVARADARQKSIGLAYVEAERQDLAREICNFARFHGDAARLKSLAKEAATYIRTNVNEIGGCDHSVGICCCADLKLAGELEEAAK